MSVQFIFFLLMLWVIISTSGWHSRGRNKPLGNNQFLFDYMSWSFMLNNPFWFLLCSHQNKVLLSSCDSLHPGSVDVMQAGAPLWRLHLHKHTDTHRGWKSVNPTPEDLRPSSCNLSWGSKCASETLICDEDSRGKNEKVDLCGGGLKQGAHFLWFMNSATWTPNKVNSRRGWVNWIWRDAGDILKPSGGASETERKLKIWLVCGSGNHSFLSHYAFWTTFYLYFCKLDTF